MAIVVNKIIVAVIVAQIEVVKSVCQVPANLTINISNGPTVATPSKIQKVEFCLECCLNPIIVRGHKARIVPRLKIISLGIKLLQAPPKII
jgi:hypothetical protein